MRSVATIILPVIMMLSLSCTPDCKEITISIADWQTHYEDYWVELDSVAVETCLVDTIVSYSVERYYTKMNYMANSNGKETGATCTHFIRIRNNNNTFANRFAVRITGKEYNEAKGSWQVMSKTTNYVTIAPNCTHTFQITHDDWWHNRTNGYSEDDVALNILQSSILVEHTSKKIIHNKRKQIRRIDELIMKDTIVNNCDCDVDALRARSEAVSSVFEQLKKQNLIHTN